MCKKQKIAIHGVPRSGTTWLGAILDSSPNVAYRYQPLFSYTHKSFLSETSTKKDIDIFFKKILNTDDNFVLQKDAVKNGIVPFFKKTKITHIAYKEVRYHNILKNLLKKDKEIKVIGIIRNPKSVINSWYNAPKEFDKKHWSLSKEWKYAKSKNQNKKEEFYGYNKWKEVAEMFLYFKKKYPENFLLIKYHDLLYNTINETEKIYGFCNLKLTKQTLDFINKSKQKDFSDNAYSVYRKNQTDNKWQKNLPSHIAEKIDKDLYNTELNIFNI